MNCRGNINELSKELKWTIILRLPNFLDVIASDYVLFKFWSYSGGERREDNAPRRDVPFQRDICFTNINSKIARKDKVNCEK